MLAFCLVRQNCLPTSPKEEKFPAEIFLLKALEQGRKKTIRTALKRCESEVATVLSVSVVRA